MPKGPIELDRSEGARAGLAGMIAEHAQPEADFLQTELEASAYWQKCEREDLAEREAKRRNDAEKARKDKIEHQITEGLEIATGVAAGVLGSWRTSGGFPIGDTLNGVVGLAAKAGSVIDPESRPVRVVARAGKVLLHSEVSMFTRNLIEKNKS